MPRRWECVRRLPVRGLVACVAVTVALGWGSASLACRMDLNVAGAQGKPTLVDYARSGKPVMLVRLSPYASDPDPEPGATVAAVEREPLRSTLPALKPASREEVIERLLEKAAQAMRAPQNFYCMLDVLDTINSTLNISSFKVFEGMTNCHRVVPCNGQTMALPMPEDASNVYAFYMLQLEWTDVAQWPEAKQAAVSR